MPAAATVEGGCTNSHPRAKNGAPRATEYGVDTWRLVHYLDDRELEVARARCPQRVRGGWIAPGRVHGHVVGVAPAHRMLFLEGHPAVEGLARPGDLLRHREDLLQSMASEGWPLGRDGGMARVDATATIRFEDPREGMVFLAGVAALDVPRCKPAIYGRPPETVYWLAERSGKKLARAYDKGLEAGIAPQGQLIRLESQSRYTKEARMDVTRMEPTYVAERFSRRFAPLAASAEGITAGTLPVLADELRGRVLDGSMTRQQAERLGGYLLLGGDRLPGARRTKQRRRRELRDHGLVLADPLSDPIAVDLVDGLDAALAAWSDA